MEEQMSINHMKTNPYYDENLFQDILQNLYQITKAIHAHYSKEEDKFILYCTNFNNKMKYGLSSIGITNFEIFPENHTLLLVKISLGKYEIMDYLEQSGYVEITHYASYYCEKDYYLVRVKNKEDTSFVFRIYSEGDIVLSSSLESGVEYHVKSSVFPDEVKQLSFFDLLQSMITSIILNTY